MSKPILLFHALDLHHDPISLPPDGFATMLRSLAEAGQHAKSLGRGMESSGWDCILTFDDGYASVYDHALPILQELGFFATIFLTVGMDGTLPPLLGRPLMTWTQVRDLHAAGVEIGAHTLTHPDLTHCDEAILHQEVIRPKQIIEDKLGAAVASFAYPFGRYDSRVASLVAQHYRYAVTTDLRFMCPDDVPHLLPRIETYYLRPRPLQQLVASPSLASYMRLRRLGRGTRTVINRLSARNML